MVCLDIDGYINAGWCVMLYDDGWRWRVFYGKKDQACVDQRVNAARVIMVDYSGQTSLCQDCACSNRSQQILSDVLGPLPWKCLL